MDQEDIRRLVENVLEADDQKQASKLPLGSKRPQVGATQAGSRIEVSLLASGGYNDVWLVSIEGHSAQKNTSPVAFVTAVLNYLLQALIRLVSRVYSGPSSQPSTIRSKKKVIVRIPNEDSLKPHQIRNEVGWLKYIASHHAHIAVPEVHTYSDGENGTNRLFIVEEYMDGRSLDDTWMEYSEADEETVAKQIAELVVNMGEIRFDLIGGMKPNGDISPTVEGNKLFKGRDKFHTSECYDIGPYRSAEDHIAAMYDKEIYFYTHADEDCFDEDCFASISRTDFIKSLKEKKIADLAALAQGPLNEPFVLCHNDLHSRNILMQGTKVVGVIDWEFAGAYPLSELGDDIEVLEIEDEASEEECFKWSGRISEMLEQAIKDRGWVEADVKALTSGGNVILQNARVEMFPE